VGKIEKSQNLGFFRAIWEIGNRLTRAQAASYDDLGGEGEGRESTARLERERES
jgi:hypothetical protein